ncbi:MAG: hypothetical protein HYY26_04700 [Acidobacteria bacterium]|nr:hypothetical protein [Acidobacteriota bacterium]
MSAGILVLIALNLLGLGSILGGRFLTGFLVGTGTYLLVGTAIEALAAQARNR